MLEYKGEERGIEVVRQSERDTSKTCSACGTEDGNQRVERGLYVCDDCGTVANADVNGAENIRRKVPPSPKRDRSTGWIAQPAVHLFDRSEGVSPRENRPWTANPNIPTRYGKPRRRRRLRRLCEGPPVPLRSRRGGCHSKSNRRTPTTVEF